LIALCLTRRGDPPHGPLYAHYCTFGTAFVPAHPTCYLRRSYQSPNQLLNPVGRQRVYRRALGAGQAVTGRKILTGTPEFLGEVNTGPQFYGAVEGGRDVWRWSVARSIYLLISGGRYFLLAEGTREPRSRFFEISRNRSAPAAGSPRARGRRLAYSSPSNVFKRLERHCRIAQEYLPHGLR